MADGEKLPITYSKSSLFSPVYLRLSVNYVIKARACAPGIIYYIYIYDPHT